MTLRFLLLMDEPTEPVVAALESRGFSVTVCNNFSPETDLTNTDVALVHLAVASNGGNVSHVFQWARVLSKKVTTYLIDNLNGARSPQVLEALSGVHGVFFERGLLTHVAAGHYDHTFANRGKPQLMIQADQAGPEVAYVAGMHVGVMHVPGNCHCGMNHD